MFVYRHLSGGEGVLKENQRTAAQEVARHGGIVGDWWVAERQHDYRATVVLKDGKIARLVLLKEQKMRFKSEYLLWNDVNRLGCAIFPFTNGVSKRNLGILLHNGEAKLFEEAIGKAGVYTTTSQRLSDLVEKESLVVQTKTLAIVYNFCQIHNLRAPNLGDWVKELAS